MAVLFSKLAMSAFDHTDVFAALLALLGQHGGNSHAQQNKCGATGRGLEVHQGVEQRRNVRKRNGKNEKTASYHRVVMGHRKKTPPHQETLGNGTHIPPATKGHVLSR